MVRKITNKLISLPQDVSIGRVVNHPHSMEIFISCLDTDSLCPVCGSRDCVIKDSGHSLTIQHIADRGLSSLSMYPSSSASVAALPSHLGLTLYTFPLNSLPPPASDSPAHDPSATSPSTTAHRTSIFSILCSVEFHKSASLPVPSVLTSSRALPAPMILIHTDGMSAATIATFPTATLAALLMSSRKSPGHPAFLLHVLFP